MRTVFQADDGQIFNLKSECFKHEAEIKKSLSRNKLRKLCLCMNTCMYNDLADDDKSNESISNYMANHIIKNVKDFGLAITPFIKE